MYLFYLFITFCFLQAVVTDGPTNMKDITDNALKQIAKIRDDLQCQCFEAIKPLPFCVDSSDSSRREIMCKALKSIIDNRDVNPLPIPTTQSTTTGITTLSQSPTTQSTTTGITTLSSSPTTQSTTTGITTPSPSPTTQSTTTGITTLSQSPTTQSTTTGITTLSSSPTTQSTTTGITTPSPSPTTQSTTTGITTPSPSPTTQSTTTGITTPSPSPTTTENTTPSKIDNSDSAKFNINNQNKSNNGLIIAVALGCFVLGALVVVVAKLLYNHYRQKSYVLPPEQEMS